MADKSLKEIAESKNITPPFWVKEDLFKKYQQSSDTFPPDGPPVAASVNKSTTTETVTYEPF